MPRNDPLATSRERLPYVLKTVADELRDMSRVTDDTLEDVIAEFLVSLEDDGVIDDEEAMTLLVGMMKAYKGNADLLGVLDLLTESGSEAALRKVERVRAQRRTRQTKVKAPPV